MDEESLLEGRRALVSLRMIEAVEADRQAHPATQETILTEDEMAQRERCMILYCWIPNPAGGSSVALVSISDETTPEAERITQSTWTPTSDPTCWHIIDRSTVYSREHPQLAFVACSVTGKEAADISHRTKAEAAS